MTGTVIHAVDSARTLESCAPPPRHIHFDREERFFVIEGGEVAVEIGDL